MTRMACSSTEKESELKKASVPSMTQPSALLSRKAATSASTALLESLGVSWRIFEGGPKTAWLVQLAALTKYLAEGGKQDMPRAFTYDGAPLGKIVSRLRSKYAQNALSEDRIDALTAIGFRFAAKPRLKPMATSIARILTALAEGVAVHDLPTTDPLGLDVWRVRNAYAKGSLPADSVGLLAQLGFSWLRGAQGKA